MPGKNSWAKRQSGMLKDAESGILYMDNVQYLDGGLLREIASSAESPEGKRAFDRQLHTGRTAGTGGVSE